MRRNLLYITENAVNKITQAKHLSSPNIIEINQKTFDELRRLVIPFHPSQSAPTWIASQLSLSPESAIREHACLFKVCRGTYAGDNSPATRQTYLILEISVVKDI